MRSHVALIQEAAGSAASPANNALAHQLMSGVGHLIYYIFMRYIYSGYVKLFIFILSLIYLFIYLFILFNVFLIFLVLINFYRFVFLFDGSFSCLLVRFLVCWFVCLFVYLFIYMFVISFVYLFVCLC